MSAESNGAAFATGALVGGVLVTGLMAGILFFSGALQSTTQTSVSERPDGLALGGGGRGSQRSSETTLPSDDDDFRTDATSPQEPLVEKDEDGIAAISPFYSLTDAEKNAYWWEIASQCIKERNDERRYFLNSATIGRLARHYGCTPVDLLQFFKAGIDADWRELEPSDE